MPVPAIRVEGLSKRYRIGARQKNRTLREAVVDLTAQPFRRLRSFGRSSHREEDSIWALKDVSFEVQPGEVVGIIGANGAGKSTLLKILSRITEPTQGRAVIKGRLASLLEVGTGFHSELTGRENIYLSGAILGMTKKEMDSKFDAIVDFSGVEKFIDTPVKRYSSGMRVRLGFAVAAHLEPKVLLIDEVLAVGDAEFQKKCLGKMGDVAKEGRTILFVSHNMAAVEHLCPSAVLLSSGRVVREGASNSVIQHYLNTVLPQTVEKVPLSERNDRSGTGAIRLTGFRLEDTAGRTLQSATSGKDTVFVLDYQGQNGHRPSQIDVGISVHDKNETTLFVLYASYVHGVFERVPRTGSFKCCLPELPLAPGRYKIGARVTVAGQEADWPRNGVGFFDVEAGDFYGTGSRGFEGNAPVLVKGGWEVDETPRS